MRQLGSSPSPGDVDDVLAVLAQVLGIPPSFRKEVGIAIGVLLAVLCFVLFELCTRCSCQCKRTTSDSAPQPEAAARKARTRNAALQRVGLGSATRERKRSSRGKRDSQRRTLVAADDDAESDLESMQSDVEMGPMDTDGMQLKMTMIASQSLQAEDNGACPEGRGKDDFTPLD